MRWCRSVLALAGLAFLQAAWPAAEPDQVQADELVLRSAGLGVDGPALVAYIRKKVDADGMGAKVKALVQQLGDDDFEKREKATTELTALGGAALPYLRQALGGPLPTLELRRRVERIVEKLPQPTEDTLALAALRLIAQRRPAGAVEALLAYLPLVTDEALAEEVRVTLTITGFKDDTAEKALLQGFKDKDAEIRSSVAEILGKRLGRRHLADIKPLLKDDEVVVRLRAAQVLAELREADAVPVLIALLVDLPPDRAPQAEAALQALAGGQAPTVAMGDNAGRQKCRDAWTAWWTGFNDKALLDLFRNSTLDDTLREKIQAAVRQLGNDDFDVREKATEAIIQTGSAAMPLLLQAVKDPDPEVVDRVKKCMSQIQKDPVKSNPAVSSRLVALRKPADGVAVLLAYLPFAHDELAVEEIQSALNVLAYQGGKPAAALVRGLDDKVALRRGVAAAALCQEESGRQSAEVRRLLKDKEPGVRLRTALALARAKDRQAFPVIIELLAELPQDQLWPADELLCRLAESRAPLAPIGTDATARQRYRDAWAAWWRDQAATIDLAKLDVPPRTLGYTMLVMPNNGRVAEYGADGKARWELNGLSYPFDARLLPGGRVLVAEYQGKRVTERSLKNEVVWEHKVMWPIACQRLANGNTFIATRNQLLEVDRTGKDVFTITRQNHDILAAQKLRNGEIGCITNTQKFIRMETTGKELKSFVIGPVHNYVQFDVLSDGGILIPQQGTNKLVEFDPDGKPRWEASVQFPYSALRLANGRTLVAQMNGNRIIELDRAGKIVWEQKTDSPPWRARRR